MQIHSKIMSALSGIVLSLSLVTVAVPGISDENSELIIPKATKSAGKDKCVLPVPEMRRNHKFHILHQRDETVHEGIRTKQFSLTECINCHVPVKPKGQEVRVSSNKHFCNSCHTYTAVSIDCFQCHNDQPTTNPYTAKNENKIPETQKFVKNSVSDSKIGTR